MRAYKVLIGGRSRFTGWRWPLPERDRPGSWVQADGPLALCVNGVHACTVAQLPQWLGDELWLVELDGEIIHTEPALLAARGRLLALVAGWDQAARTEFGASCARRARAVSIAGPQGEVLLGAIEHLAGLGQAAAVGYWTAVLAGEHDAGRRSGLDYDRAFARERTAQARWLSSELKLVG